MVTKSGSVKGQQRTKPITYGDLFQRLGGTNEVAQATWLLEFAQRDLTTTSDQEIASLCELLPIVGPWQREERVQVANQPAPRIDWLAPYSPSSLAKRFAPIDRALVSSDLADEVERATQEMTKRPANYRLILRDLFQKPVHDLFSGLLQRGEATTEEVRFSLRLRKGAPLPESIPDPKSPHELFIFRAAHVIQAVSDRLVPCANPQCHCGPHGRRMIFIQSRRDREFCSEACGSRIRMERKRKRDATQKAKAKKRRNTRSAKGVRHGKK